MVGCRLGPAAGEERLMTEKQLDLFTELPPASPALTLVAFDLETTGLKASNGDIIEIAGVKFSLDGKEIGSRQQFANPGYPVPEVITKITGITTEMVVGAPSPLDAVQQFLTWAGDSSLLVAHNAPFDAQFMVSCFRKNKKNIPALQVFDTLPWARTCWPGLPNHKLGTLLKKVSANTEGLHRSLADARGVMALALHFLEAEKDREAAVIKRAMDLQQMSRVNYWR